MEKGTKTLEKMVELNNLINKTNIELNVIKAGNIQDCPYFKEKPFCTTPNLKENKNKTCECFSFMCVSKENI